MALALQMCFGLPLRARLPRQSSLVVIPLVMHGITLISRLQLWTQPIWIVLHRAALRLSSLRRSRRPFGDWTELRRHASATGSGVRSRCCSAPPRRSLFSLVVQIGEQVDFLRFLPREDAREPLALVGRGARAPGPGWIVPGMLKMLARLLPRLPRAAARASRPSRRSSRRRCTWSRFGYVFASPAWRAGADRRSSSSSRRSRSTSPTPMPARSPGRTSSRG